MKNAPRLLLGLSGLCLTLAFCRVEPVPSTPGFALLALLSAFGGLLPLRLPGLGPLPGSLPLVGAIAVAGDVSQAMVLGFLSGLATAMAPGPVTFRVESRWLTGWSVAGAMSLAAGVAAAGVSTFGLEGRFAEFPSAPAFEEAARLTALLAGGILLARLFPVVPDREAVYGAGEVSRRLPRAGGVIAGAFGAALLSMALAAARGRIGDPAWLGGLACAAAGSLALMGPLRAERRRALAAARRAETGRALVESIALAIEAKDRTSERHLRRMRVYSVEVGRQLGLPSDELEDLEYAAVLHDIGKLVIPESILSKPAGLTTEEFEVMSSHAKVGAEILETTTLSSRVAAMVRHHHERYDGSGYPDGLVGMEIPLGSRILAATDTFEALTSERPYRHGVSPREAVAYLRRHAGTLFDPRVVRVLAEHHAAFEEIVRQEAGRTTRASDATRAGRSGEHGRGPDTLRIHPPLQLVLDRIASSHMEIYSLHEISQVLGKSLNLEESFALIASRLQRLIHFSACAIYVVDAERGMLHPRFAAGSGAARILEQEIPLGARLSGWAALHRRTIIGAPPGSPAIAGSGPSDLAGIDDHPEIAPLQCSLSAPLMVDDALLGVVALYDLAPSEYTPQEERLLSLAARQVAAAVRTGLLFEQTQEHALTDSLTGLPNSRYMFIAFDQEATRSREEGSPLTLLLMDIDNFREINDHFGHHAGDRFLAGMAKAIRSQLRVCDTCIRYAGDEFVAIMPRLAGDEVDRVIERIRDAARDYCLEARPGRPVRVTLSIGCATMPGDGGDFESLMAAASSRVEREKTRRIPSGPSRRPKRHTGPIGPASGPGEIH